MEGVLFVGSSGEHESDERLGEDNREVFWRHDLQQSGGHMKSHASLLVRDMEES